MPQDGSPPITLTITPNPQVTNVAASSGAFGRLGLDPRGTVQWNGGDNFSYFGHDWATNDNAQLEIFDDPQLGAAVRAEQEPDPPPDAVWTTTPRELIRDGAAPLYSSTTPDVALTPRGSATPPIPYDTWARPTHPLQFPSSVRAAGQNVMVLRSQETLTYGAEQGVAMGVKSGTIMGPVQPLEHSTTVRAEGSEVIRDGDAVWMNNRNNLGVAELAGSTVANGPTPPEPEEEPGFWGSLWDGAGDAWDATKEAASDAAAAIGEFDRNHGAVLTRGVGVVQAVGGVGEAILGAGLVGGGGAASATGVGAAPGIPAMVGGAALWVNGWDNAVTGMRTAWTGEFQHNLMSEAIGGTAGALGASPETVESIMNTTDLASGALSIGGGVAAGTRAAGRETLEVASRQVDEVAEASAEQSARVTQRTRLPRTNGRWDGQPGNGTWYPDNADARSILGDSGVPFRDGRPDFSSWSRGEIEFEPGILNGGASDFTRVYEQIKVAKGLPSNHAAQQYLRNAGLTPHHLNGTVIQLIPTKLHGNIPHIGSASDLRGGL